MSVSSLYMTGFHQGAGYVDIFDIAVIYHTYFKIYNSVISLVSWDMKSDLWRRCTRFLETTVFDCSQKTPMKYLFCYLIVLDIFTGPFHGALNEIIVCAFRSHMQQCIRHGTVFYLSDKYTN